MTVSSNPTLHFVRMGLAIGGLQFLLLASVAAQESHFVWPGLAPGETQRHVGDMLPMRPGESPPVTRLTNISCPTYTVHLAEKPNGSAVVILPGGGFGRVVPDKEGSEAAVWLNQLGISAFVLRYRTSQADSALPGWRKPLQDAQRMISLVRSRSHEWGIAPDRIGLLAFSAGGQVAARLLSNLDHPAYERLDEIDSRSFRPSFAMLIYPWKMLDVKTGSLSDGIRVSKNCPPTFLVHTDDDRSSSLGSVLFYVEMKRLKIPSELHVYGNGGHGYGLRPVTNSQISTWTDHAGHWLQQQGF